MYTAPISLRQLTSTPEEPPKASSDSLFVVKPVAPRPVPVIVESFSNQKKTGSWLVYRDQSHLSMRPLQTLRFHVLSYPRSLRSLLLSKVSHASLPPVTSPSPGHPAWMVCFSALVVLSAHCHSRVLQTDEYIRQTIEVHLDHLFSLLLSILYVCISSEVTVCER